MNYKVGDTVVCLSGREGRDCGGGLLQAGSEYVVGELNATCVGVLGITADSKTPCIDCHTAGELGHIDTWRFIKLEPPAVKARSDLALVEVE